MDLMTKDYKLYKTMKKVIMVLVLLFLIVLGIMVYNGVMYGLKNGQLGEYAGTPSVSTLSEELQEVSKEKEIKDKELMRIEDMLSREMPSLEELEAFNPNNIMNNVRNSTNNGIKLHNVVLMGGEIEIAGVSTEIEEISSFVLGLSAYYEVDIQKTQQINHPTEGLHYAFTLRLKGRGV